MMYFPRPYPDELLGSLIVRARLHLGLSSTQMGMLLFDKVGARIRFMFSPVIPRLVELARLDADELLEQHTPFFYATSFLCSWMTHHLREALIGSACLSRSDLDVLDFAVIRGRRHRRYCPLCAREDIQRFREAYWHRIHNLPGVDICVRHGCELWESSSTLTYGLPGNCELLPFDSPVTVVNSDCGQDVRWRIAEKSVRLLRKSETRLIEWQRSYRQRACALGFGASPSNLNLALIGRACDSLFGEAFLQAYEVRSNRSRIDWTASILHDDIAHATVDTFEHVLFRVFLDAGTNATSVWPDAQELADAAMARDIHEQARQLLANGQTSNINALLKHAGAHHIYRARTPGYPLMRGAIEDFLKTDASHGRTHRRRTY